MSKQLCEWYLCTQNYSVYITDVYITLYECSENGPWLCKEYRVRDEVVHADFLREGGWS